MMYQRRWTTVRADVTDSFSLSDNLDILVIFQIEAGLKDSLIPKSETSGRTFVQQLFCGTSRQVLNLEAGSPGQKARVKDELFSYLLVDVANEGTDLYDGLDAAFEPSTVEVEGHSAVRQDVLTHLPPVLQIQLQVRS